MSKGKPTVEGRGFGSLANFSPSKESPAPKLENEPVKASEFSESEVAPSGDVPTEALETKPSSLAATEATDNENGLSPEDERDFNRIIQLLNVDILSKGLNFAKSSLASEAGNIRRYYRIKEFFRSANKCDVENFYNYHNLRSEAGINSEIDSIFKALLLRGYKSQAVGWIKSLTVEGLKYGTVPGLVKPNAQEKKAFRIAEARKFAEKAGVSLEDLVAENKLEHLLRE